MYSLRVECISVFRWNEKVSTAWDPSIHFKKETGSFPEKLVHLFGQHDGKLQKKVPDTL